MDGGVAWLAVDQGPARAGTGADILEPGQSRHLVIGASDEQRHLAHHLGRGFIRLILIQRHQHMAVGDKGRGQADTGGLEQFRRRPVEQKVALRLWWLCGQPVVH